MTDDAMDHVERNTRLARRLALVLIVVCAAMMLLGPTIADSVLAILGCRTDTVCGPIVGLVAERFAAFHQADRLMDVPFIFVIQFWPVILVSIGLILHVRYRKPPELAAAPMSPLDEAVQRAPVYRWARRSAWVCLASLIAFCVLLGTPFVATGTARVLLSGLGCDVDPWRVSLPIAAFGSGRSLPACLEWPGFWIPRLRDYVDSIDGWFTAPYLLLRHFGWMILAWAAFTAMLAGLATLARRRALGA